MATNGTNFTYTDAARREDLLDVLTNIDPVEDRLFKLFGKTTAYNTLHEWPVDTLEAVGDNAQPEGGDAPTDGATDPTRLVNITQIFAKTARVSGTEQAVNSAGFSDRMAYEITKKMKALSNDVELALVRGSIASGLATTGSANGRRLKGIKNWITTNASNYSGATLTETVFNDMLQASWDQGGNINSAVTSMKGKRRISGFTAGSTKNIDADDKRLVNSINVYESDAAGTVKILAHRMVTRSGDYGTTATPGFDVLLLQDDTWKVAILQGREPKTVDLAVTGDYVAKEIITELTLESRAEKANVMGRVFF
jgi:hypothetical protein